jgi:hypothetical protein
MPAPKLSEAVKAYLEALIAREGEKDFTVEQAEAIYGGKPGALKDLTTVAQLQYALMASHVEVLNLYDQVNALTAAMPNRAARRKLLRP